MATQADHIVAVGDARPASADKPSAGPIYRNVLAKDGPLKLEASTLYELFTRSVEKYPDNLCLGKRDKAAGKWPEEGAQVVGEYVWKTYKQVGEEVALLASGLRAIGTNPSQRVGVLGANSPEWMMAMQVRTAARLRMLPEGLWAPRRQGAPFSKLFRSLAPSGERCASWPPGQLSSQRAAAQRNQIDRRAPANRQWIAVPERGGDGAVARKEGRELGRNLLSACPRTRTQACNRLSLHCVPLYDSLGENAIEYIINHAEVVVAFVDTSKFPNLLKVSACSAAGERQGHAGAPTYRLGGRRRGRRANGAAE